MNAYLIFSDEYESYKRNPSEAFLSANPFYLRGCLIIKIDDYIGVIRNFINLKTMYNIPVDKEVKWNYIWQLRRYEGQAIPENKPFKFLENIEHNSVLNFVRESLNLMNNLDYSKLIFTCIFNRMNMNQQELYIIKMHLQYLMQRIELELRANNGYGILVFDSINRLKNNILKNAYNDIYINGDMFINYEHIVDGLNIEHSHYSAGIQLVDYLCGSFASVLKYNGINYIDGSRIFAEYVYPHIRRGNNDEIGGYGIIEIPRNDNERNSILNKIETIINEFS